MADIAGTGLAADRPQRGVPLPEGLFAWLLIVPEMIFIGFIVAGPLVETIRLSFTDADLGGENYIGLENYARLFRSSKFYGIIGRTFNWMLLAVSLKLIMGLIGTTLLNAAVPGKALFRILVMPPWVIPIATGVIGWKWQYNSYFRLISGLLQEFGLVEDRIALLATKT